MTPKQKAEELVEKYRILLQDTDTDVGEEILCTIVAKIFARIAVDEILIVLAVAGVFSFLNEIKFWEEVKEEIIKY
jgi:hypothetical protein